MAKHQEPVRCKCLKCRRGDAKCAVGVTACAAISASIIAGTAAWEHLLIPTAVFGALSALLWIAVGLCLGGWPQEKDEEPGKERSDG